MPATIALVRESLIHLKLPVGSLLHKCANAVPRKEPSQPASQTHGEHDGTNNCQKCDVFYCNFVELDSSRYAALKQMTIEQSASHLWHDSRRIRITASSARKVPVRADPAKFIL